MVYCTKCGTQNEEEAKHCTKCGASLEALLEERFERRAEKWGEQFGKRAEEECFDLPHGSAIVALLIGIIIILVGLAQVPGLIPPGVRRITDPLFWPVIIIVVGVLIIAGALYRYSRRS